MRIRGKRRSGLQRSVTVLVFLVLASAFVPGGIGKARAQAEPYPSMAPLREYLMPRDAEIALARSAAPASIAGGAGVMVPGPEGYTTVVHGDNGFLCYVERSWAHDTSHPEFWNPKMRAPNCFNAAAVRSVSPIYLLKTRLVLSGRSRTAIAHAVAAALDSGRLPSMAPGAMCYMMSKQQYLNDKDRRWYPHLMFYARGDVAKSWGANLPGSPLLAADDPQGRFTTFMVVVDHWSDGTPRPPIRR